MGTRPCARCGTQIPTTQYLCASCREERPIQVPVLAVPTDAETQTDGGAEAIAGTGASSPAMWRGRPIPRGMILPSRTQYHGTMYAMIALGVAITLALGVLVNRGVGPFTVTDLTFTSSGGVPIVSAKVLNVGDHGGKARCVATWTTVQGGRQQSQVIETAPIGPSATGRVSVPLVGLAQVPPDAAIDCK